MTEPASAGWSPWPAGLDGAPLGSPVADAGLAGPQWGEAYLLFDGGFAELLIQLGREDARARSEDWVRFFSDEPESPAEAAQMGPPEVRRRKQTPAQGRVR